MMASVARRPIIRRVLLFGLPLLPLFSFFLWLYPKVFPTYSGWVLAGVNAGYRAWSVPLEVRTAPDGLTAYVSHPDGTSQLLVTDHTPENVLLSLILLPTLLLATPIAVGKRVLLLLVGGALLYIAHVVCLGIFFHELLLLRLGQAGPLSNWLLACVLTSGQTGAIVLWALLTGGYWFPGALGSIRFRGRTNVARNAACPCGSGRKYKRCCEAFGMTRC
jgi:SEC-C motif-containing protein